MQLALAWAHLGSLPLPSLPVHTWAAACAGPASLCTPAQVCRHLHRCAGRPTGTPPPINFGIAETGNLFLLTWLFLSFQKFSKSSSVPGNLMHLAPQALKLQTAVSHCLHGRIQLKLRQHGVLLENSAWRNFRPIPASLAVPAVSAVSAITDGRTANPRPLLPTNTPPLKSNRGLGLAVCHTNGLKTTPQSANGGYSGQTLEILSTNYPPITIIKWSRIGLLSHDGAKRRRATIYVKNPLTTKLHMYANGAY